MKNNDELFQFEQLSEELDQVVHCHTPEETVEQENYDVTDYDFELLKSIRKYPYYKNEIDSSHYINPFSSSNIFYTKDGQLQ